MLFSSGVGALPASAVRSILSPPGLTDLPGLTGSSSLGSFLVLALGSSSSLGSFLVGLPLGFSSSVIGFLGFWAASMPAMSSGSTRPVTPQRSHRGGDCIECMVIDPERGVEIGFLQELRLYTMKAYHRQL